GRQMLVPVAADGAVEHRAERGIGAHLDIKVVDQPPDCLIGDFARLRERIHGDGRHSVHVTSATTTTPNTVQTSELNSMRTRSRFSFCPRPSAEQAASPGSRNSQANRPPMEMPVLTGFVPVDIRGAP